jgi:hypothetical protein
LEKDYTHESDDTTTNTGSDEEVYERIQTESRNWLSYSNIVGTMPDSKIREAIKRYKHLIREMEQELLLRSKIPTRYSSKTYESSYKSKSRSITSESQISRKVDRLLSLIARSGLGKQVIEYLSTKK